MTLDSVAADWTVLGAQDPLWAVLVTPGLRHGGWDPEAFFATGRSEIGTILRELDALGLAPLRTRALDFGCGVGRLSQALADTVGSVTAVDISPTMLAKARELDPHHRIDFVLNERPDLSVFADQSFDVAVSSLVLQHLPTRIARDYLAELLRVITPGGALVVQVATRPNHSLKGLLFRYAPRGALRFAQRRLLGYPAPMDMHPLSQDDMSAVAQHSGGEIVEARDVPMYGGHWIYTRYYLTRR